VAFRDDAQPKRPSPALRYCLGRLQIASKTTAVMDLPAKVYSECLYERNKHLGFSVAAVRFKTVTLVKPLTWFRNQVFFW
jgi:hypothetical protein